MRAARGKARIKAVPTGIAHGTVTAVIGGAPVEVTTLRRDVATDGRRATIAYHRGLARGRGAARLHHQRALRRSGERRDLRLFRRPRRSRGAPGPLHRRSAAAHRRGSSAHPALLPLPRPLRRGRARRGGARRLRRARQRSDGAVARADRRRAAEAARACPIRRRPCALMIARGILRPVLPEIESARAARRPGRGASAAAGIAPDADPAARRACCPPIPRSPPRSRRGCGCRSALAKRLVSAADAALDAPERARLSDRRRRGGRPLPAARQAEARPRARWQAGSGRACRSAAAI